MTVRVQKWGNSLGCAFPKAIARQSAIREGIDVEIVCEDDRVILQAVKVPSLKRLLAQAKPGNRPELVKWGKPHGREVW